MKKLFWSLLLLLGLSVVLSGCQAAISSASLSPSQPSPSALIASASPTALSAMPPSPSPRPSWIGLWRLPKGKFLLITYRGPTTLQDATWEVLKQRMLPAASSWNLLPGEDPGHLWLVASRTSGEVFWPLAVEDLTLGPRIPLAPSEDAPLGATWNPEGPKLVLQTWPSAASSPCWDVWDLKSGERHRIACAEEQPDLAGKTFWPLGWLDDRTLYGLRLDVTLVTPTAPGASNVTPTGSWELLAVDATTGQVQRQALPPLPSDYQRPLVTAGFRRLSSDTLQVEAIASQPADTSCPTFVVSQTWRPATHTWEASPQSRCLSFPVTRMFPLGEATLWLQGDEARPEVGQVIVEGPRGTQVQSLPDAAAFWAPWNGSTAPRLWQDGVLVGAQHMTDQGAALMALYWLSLQGADPPRRVSLPPPPEAKAQLLALWPTK